MNAFVVGHILQMMLLRCMYKYIYVYNCTYTSIGIVNCKSYSYNNCTIHSTYLCTVEGKSKWHHQVFQDSFLLKR